ncbi:MAG TPA: hypothetical protein V6C65_04145 [Allocoleopsis sp.]
MGICTQCGEETEQEPLEYDGIDQVVCDNCYGDFEYCEFCKIHRHEYSLCRHLFWSNQVGEILGCGSDRNKWESTHKSSFFKVLDKIGVDAAQSLLRSLKAHQYFHQFSGTIFDYERLRADWMDSDGSFSDYGHLFTESLFEEEEEEMAIGVQWLVSLWAGDFGTWNDCGLAKTPEADDLTASWIEEWSKKDRKC